VILVIFGLPMIIGFLMCRTFKQYLFLFCMFVGLVWLSYAVAGISFWTK
jgi:hypothetical protein